MEPLYWLILLAIFLVIEIITLGLTTIWLAGGALVGFLAAVLHVPLPIQIVLFLVVSIVLIVFTRPVAERYFNNSREQTNVGGIIGREGKVIVTIDNFNQTGAVLIDESNGQREVTRRMWSLRRESVLSLLAWKVSACL